MWTVLPLTEFCTWSMSAGHEVRGCSNGDNDAAQIWQHVECHQDEVEHRTSDEYRTRFRRGVGCWEGR